MLLSRWPNETAVVGTRAILRCPLDTANSCLVDLVEWYKTNELTGKRSLLRNDRVTVFAFDPLLLYMEDTVLSDSGWYTCVVGNAAGRAESRTYLNIVHGDNVPLTDNYDENYRERWMSNQEGEEEDEYEEEEQEYEYTQASNQVENLVQVTKEIQLASGVHNSLQETTTTEAPPGDKWGRFRVYSKFRGSRVSGGGGGAGAAYAAAATYIPREYTRTSEEEGDTRAYPLTYTSERPYTPYQPTSTRTTTTTTTSRPEYTTQQPRYYSQPTERLSNVPWNVGGKQSIPDRVGAHLTNRDHLEAIHNHLRYIYDRLDDLLDRVHDLEMQNRHG